MTHLEREIHEQPAVLERLLRTGMAQMRRIAKRIHEWKPRAVFLVARGSSDNAGLYAKYLLGARNRQVVALAAPSLFTLYGRPPDLRNCLVVAISQSGGSVDLRAVMAEARRQGAVSLLVTNTAQSPLARTADEVIHVRAGRERSVAATKTYTAELMALAMLSVALRGTQRDEDALLRVPDAVAAILEQQGQAVAAAERYRYMERLSVIGRGYNYATAFELSLKLKELAYVTAEPSSSADFRHGPIAVVAEGFPVLLVGPRGQALADVLGLARALRKRHAELLVITESRELRGLAQTVLPYRSGLPEWLSPLVAVVPGQLFAMKLAEARGCPLDQPRGLSKITRTR